MIVWPRCSTVIETPSYCLHILGFETHDRVLPSTAICLRVKPVAGPITIWVLFRPHLPSLLMTNFPARPNRLLKILHILDR